MPSNNSVIDMSNDNTSFKRNHELKNEFVDFRNILSSLRAIFILENVFGLVRFRVKNNKVMPTDGIVKLIVLCMTGAFICICTVCTSLYSCTVRCILLDGLVFLNTLLFFVYIVFTLIIQSIMKTSTNVQLILFFAELDSKLSVNIGYRKAHAIVIVIFNIFLNLLFTILYYFADLLNFYEAVLVTIVNVTMDNETSLLCLLLYMLKIRLATINHSLEKMTAQKALLQGRSNAVSIRSVTKLRKLTMAYIIIGKTCGLINGIFNFQMAMMLLTCFIYTLINLSVFLCSFHFEATIGGRITMMISWCCIRVSYVVMLCFVCEDLMWTRSVTKELANALVMDYGLAACARAQAKALFKLIDAWPLRIHVYDMFSVDRALLVKCISVTTAYFIILIQISMAAK